MSCELDSRPVGLKEAVLRMLVSGPGVDVNSVDVVELLGTTELGVEAGNEAASVVECRLVIGSACYACRVVELAEATVVSKLLLLSIGFSGFKGGIVSADEDVERPAASDDVVLETGTEAVDVVG